ncbi:MAG: GNAT family N-acetyltransferase [Litorimonas sp.]
MARCVLIETDRLKLRGWQDCDREPFASINRDPEVMRYLGPLLSLADSNASIEEQTALMASGEPAFWAVEHKSSEQLIGCIGVKRVSFNAPFTPSYEIGWRLCRAYWGQGYASEGAQAALKLAFEKWDIDKIHSFTVHANLASQAVMEKIGMKRIIDGNFKHPKLAQDDPLSGHILYLITRAEFNTVT